jgi:transcriptional antiterminator RfaH
MSAGQRWYVVQTHPQSESRAEFNLRRQGFDAYLPRYKRSRRHGRKVEMVARPLFPRYLFVGFDLARDRWRAIYSTFGVSHLIFAGEEPAAIADDIVEEIRAREGEDGYVTLRLPEGVSPGSRVRIVDGLFADATGVLERIADDRRVAILLDLLGRKTRVFVPVASVGTA